MKKHFTATVYITCIIDGECKVLLHKHKKFGLWLAPGGHIENDENPVEAALREAKEETGLDVMITNTLNNPVITHTVSEIIPPRTIFEEKIPQYKNEAAHIHVDLIYFGITDKPKSVKMTEEFGWFSKEELDRLDLTREVQLISKRAMQLVKF